jgi:phosphoenolpyruvate synthase/pyruvate phosphate dikinase
MPYVKWLHQARLPREDVGGKGASLFALMAGGFSVPMGFAVTAEASRRFEEESGIAAILPDLLSKTDFKNAESVQAMIAELAPRLVEAPLPGDLVQEITVAYQDLSSMVGAACAVRSSAVGEDSARASFAGLYESYLNMRGPAAVLESVRRCYASLWADRAIRYRALRTGNAGGEAMAVVIMGLVPSEVSGITFTAHPVTGERDRVLINASWGLGEAIVSGRVTPDSFVVKKGDFAILERDIYDKELVIQPHPDGQGTIEIKPPPERASAPCLSEEAAVAVARIAADVERYYGSPQDVEWGMAGGEIYLLQSRPITTLG